MKRKAPLIIQVADVLRRACKLPIGAARNDLRQLAAGLLKLHRAGVRANVQIIERPAMATKHWVDGELKPSGKSPELS
jgi:hypothetical protein